MALIAKAAHFVLCPKCTREEAHGSIMCTDGSQVSCHSKEAARLCVDELSKRKLLTEIEKPGLLEQINNSPIPESNDFPALFVPSAAYHDATPFEPDGNVTVLSGAVDDRLVAELDAGDTDCHTLH